MNRVVLAGYGNPLRRDDAAGRHTAEQLAARFGEHVTVLVANQPLPEWSIALAEAELAFFIDATLEPRRRVRALPLEPDSAAYPLDGHSLGPQELLRLTRTVYGRTPEAFLVAIPVADTRFGEGLSPVAKRGAQRAVDLIARRLITTWGRPRAGLGLRRTRRQTQPQRDG